jgi:predicted metal-dependent hydrolase
MSGRTVRAAKLAATWRRIGPAVPDRPERAGTSARMATAAERAATIAREDAARDAAHALPHAMLSYLGTSIHFRERAIPALLDFSDDKS